MPAVTFDGAIVQRTNHLRYLRVHFDRLLTYRHMETTALTFKKGLSHLFLLYQSVVLSVIDYAIWTRPHNNVTDKSGKV